MDFGFLSKVPDQVGYQVISSDGAVVKSSGDLANRDVFAAVVLKICKTAASAPLLPDGEPLDYITVNFDSCFYSISKAGKYVFVVKRQTSRPPAVKPPLSPTKSASGQKNVQSDQR